MAKNKNKYVFKYDQNGELYNYVELNKLDKIVSYFKLEGKKLIRFDRSSDKKQLVVFKNPVRIKQKFMDGESFVSIFDAEKDECVQHTMPEKEKCITLIKDNVCVSNYGKFVIEKWKKLKKKEFQNTMPDKNNTIKSTSDISQRFPISLRSTIKSIISSESGFRTISAWSI
jgi:hypothetical protein